MPLFSKIKKPEKMKQNYFAKSQMSTRHFLAKGLLATTVAITGMLVSPLRTNAAPYGQPIPPGPFVDPFPGSALPEPKYIPGKEISFGNLTAQEGDRDQFFVNTPGQAVFFDGVGITPQSGLRNSHNYGNLQVDAIANIRDVLFQELRSNNTNLIFSIQNDRWGNTLYAEHPDGKISLWSNTKGVVGNIFSSLGTLVNGVTAQVIDSDPSYPIANTGQLIDIDGLEVWGNEPTSPGYNTGPDDSNYDANVFSPEGDGPFSVSCVDPLSNCHTYSQAEMAAAIGRSDLASSIDIDGLMTYFSNDTDSQGKNYLEMNFSIRPIDGFDGAEIWTWDGRPGNLATALVHGGHSWDTAFNLRGTLIGQGFPDMALSTALSGEDVNLDAMEAVSVPGPVPLLGLGFAFESTRRLRRRIKNRLLK